MSPSTTCSGVAPKSGASSARSSGSPCRHAVVAAVGAVGGEIVAFAGQRQQRRREIELLGRRLAAGEIELEAARLERVVAAALPGRGTRSAVRESTPGDCSLLRHRGAVACGLAQSWLRTAAPGTGLPSSSASTSTLRWRYYNDWPAIIVRPCLDQRFTTPGSSRASPSSVLLVTAGIRATPGVLMVPLESEFGWSRAVISGGRRHQHRAVRPDRSVRRVGDGSLGPAPRRSSCALALLAVSVALTTRMRNAVAADAAVGRAGRHRHRRHLDGAGRGRRHALVRRAARPGARRAVGGERDRPAGVPAAAGQRSSSSAAGASAALLVAGGRRRRVRARAGLHARSAGGPRAAAVRTQPRTTRRRAPRGAGAARGARATRCARRPSGSWPARSSSAAPAPTA